MPCQKLRRRPLPPVPTEPTGEPSRSSSRSAHRLKTSAAGRDALASPSFCDTHVPLVALQRQAPCMPLQVYTHITSVPFLALIGRSSATRSSTSRARAAREQGAGGAQCRGVRPVSTRVAADACKGSHSSRCCQVGPKVGPSVTEGKQGEKSRGHHGVGGGFA